jgi:glucosyl-3-phosphoglycerate phosphatase
MPLIKMHINLIRHAKIQTPENIVQGYDDEIVRNEDTYQKIHLARKKVETPEKIYCSNLVRAKETTRLLYSDRSDVIFTDILNEYERPSRFIGKSKADLIAFWEVENKERKYDSQWKPEDGESHEECAKRATEFYKLLLADKENGIETVAVIGHGTLFRHLACALCKVEWVHNPRIIIDLLRRFSWDNLEVKTFEI